MNNNPVVIRCSQLTKSFADGRLNVHVLRSVDLEVQAGERIAIVGSSGSGKSTLLHILGGLDLPSSGHVEVLGKRLDQLSDVERGNLRNEGLGLSINSIIYCRSLPHWKMWLCRY